MPSKTSELMVVAVLGAALVLGASPAWAQAPAAREAARQKLREGSRQLREGEYAEALKSFQDGYRIVPSPKIFFNFALAYQGLARYADALDAFERFVAQATDAAPDNLAQAREQIRELERKVGFLTVTCPQPGADILVDGSSRGRVPQKSPLAVDPGRHQLVVELGGRSRARSFVAEPGGRITLTVDLTEPKLAAPAPGPEERPVAGLHQAVTKEAPPAPYYQRAWFWGTVGVVIAAAVTTGLLLGRRQEYPSPSLGQRQVPE
jgi:tetratricopeptide (TPR) repeat protein